MIQDRAARRRRALGATIVSAVLSVALVATFDRPSSASAAPRLLSLLTPAKGTYLGSWVKPRLLETRYDSITRVEAQIGRPFAVDHQYYTWDAPIPTTYETWTASQGRIPFINWRFPSPWSSVADGSWDAWIASRADAFSAFGVSVYLTMHHEPENDTASYGTPAEYVAAYRRVVDIFRTRGVTNVGFTWTMMAWSFNPRSGVDLDAWYPGNGDVDFIAADGYNWAPGRAGSGWTSFDTVFDDANAFAMRHTKPWIVAEYGVQEDPTTAGHKARWLRDMSSVARSWPALKVVLYFDSTKVFRWDTDSSPSSLAAYRQLANEAWFAPGVGRRPSTRTIAARSSRL
jgi:hypothetical protein